MDREAKWKRHIYNFKIKDERCHAGFIPIGIKEYEEEWCMGEYQQSSKKDYVDIKWRLIIIKNKEIPNKVNALNL